MLAVLCQPVRLAVVLNEGQIEISGQFPIQKDPGETWYLSTTFPQPQCEITQKPKSHCSIHEVLSTNALWLGHIEK